MKLGLLGAIGGLGEGLSYAGKSMFDRELEMDRERRLQGIRDKEYSRTRQDAVSDMDRREAFDLDVLGKEQGFRTSEREATEAFSLDLTEREEDLREKLARIALGGLKSVEEDSEGNFFAIDGNGNTTKLVDMEGSPYKFADLAKVHQSTISGINNGAFLNDTELESAKAFVLSLEAAMMSRLQSDYGGGSLGMTPGMTREQAIERLSQNPSFQDR